MSDFDATEVGANGLREGCGFSECLRPAARKGYCWQHYRMHRLNLPLRPLRLYGQPMDCLYEAALRYADAEDDEEHRAASKNLLRAARAYSWHVLSKSTGLQKRAASGLTTLRRMLVW